MDGLEFLDRFLDGAEQTNIPIVMLTGHGNEEIAVQAMKRGIHDYLIKGLNSDGIRQVVHAAIDQGVLRQQIDVQRRELERMAEERLSLIAQLKLRTAALADANLRKDEFLAMLAHELRNPLAAIGNAAAVIAMTDANEHAAHSNDIIRRQTKNLSRLIDDLLDVSAINLGKIELRREIIDATAILNSAVQAVKALADERKHALHVALDQDKLWVDADPTRFEQIVVNLLHNAAKYSKDGGQIWLDNARTRRGSHCHQRQGYRRGHPGRAFARNVRAVHPGRSLRGTIRRGPWHRIDRRKETGRTPRWVHRGQKQRCWRGQQVYHPPTRSPASDDGNSHRRASTGVRTHFSYTYTRS